MSVSASQNSTSNSSSINNPNAGPITFTGLGSGIDTASIIQKLISIDQIPVQQLQQQQQNIQSLQAVYGQLSSTLQAFGQTATSLSSPSTFNAITPTSSDSTVATVTAASTAGAGTYNLSVTQLAQAQTISSSAKTDVTSAQNLSGVIVVNGHAVSIAASDSLTTMASKINGLNAGVTANLINGGTGAAYLTLASNSTGVANQLQVADFGGNVLSSLGFTNGTDAIRSPITNGAQSYGFSSSTTTLQTLLGSTGGGTASITINGTAVSVNPATDTLQTIANNINTNVSGVTASVVSTTTNGQSSYKLHITGASTPTFVDGGDILESLGVLQQGVSSQLVAAKDANYSLNGVNLTSASNTITSAIPGVTLTLLKGTNASPGTATLNFSQNTSTIVSSLQGFVSAYNNVVGFLSQNSQFDQKSFQSGPLFGDPLAQQVQNGLNNMVFQPVPGVTGTYTNLAQIGFGTDQSGNLTLDTNALNNALTSNPGAVANLFQAIGSTTNASLSYVASSPQTQPTTTGSYAVNITQAATKQTSVATTAQTTNTPYEETLTFNGALFQNNPYTLNLDIGTSLAQTVSKINSDATLSGVVYASINGGKLEIDSKTYGTSGNFTVTSNNAAASNNSGIGTTGPTITAGVDVAGTINGEAATGHGQFLVGNSTNTTTPGLDLQYTGSVTGNIGSVNFSQGMGGQLSNFLNSFTQPNTGIIATLSNSENAQIAALQTQVDSLNAELAIEQQTLTQEFSAMQSALSALNSQSTALTALTTPSTTSTTTTGTSF